MAINFECEGCGRAYSVSDHLAGETGQCKRCGERMTIPSASNPAGYMLEPAREPMAAQGPPMSFRRASSSSMGDRSPFDAAGASPPEKGFLGGRGRGVVGVLIAVVLMGARVYFRWDRAQAGNGQNARANAMAPVVANLPLAPAADRSGQIALPAFPDPGPAREIEPGILLREVTLGPARPPIGSPPGFGGKLWLYLPSGRHEPRSLPCVLITAAGSNLLTGMGLGDDDRPEHLPYVHAGFAVLAFELDGVVANRERPTDADMGRAMVRFLNARAGLVNAHIAFEYALKKVPEIDPSKISVAGHSSAGTLAVLFAEHEHRLKACVAFAPALDLERRFGPQDVAQLTRAGLGDLCVRYSPRRNEENLKAPLFLFHAMDDSNTPVEGSEAFVADLNARGRDVTLDVVLTGNHYDSMINEGIPHAIAWLNEQGAGPVAEQEKN